MKLTELWILLAILAGFGIVGAMDYADARASFCERHHKVYDRETDKCIRK